MAKKIDLRSSLQNSLEKERKHIDTRFANAESIMSTNPKEILATKEVTVIKEKAVRDSFSMPQDEYESLSALRMRCLKLGLDVSRSEVVRASLKYLGQLSDNEIVAALGDINKLKPGPARRSDRLASNTDTTIQ